MRTTSFLYKVLPARFKMRRYYSQECADLSAQVRLSTNASALCKADISVSSLLRRAAVAEHWATVRSALDGLCIPDGTGGVNPGDRRAVYHLIRALHPESVLEVGTHIGASTLHIAAALHEINIKGQPAELSTVDIADVNAIDSKPWLKYGMTLSPTDMLRRLNYAERVHFVTDTSTHFLDTCDKKYDFIFLDGDHSASMVYQEIPRALRRLKPDGIILLHDYYPNLNPLHRNGSILPGPYLAVRRLIEEGARLRVLPLGRLPWPTKLGSNVTSLALLIGR